MLSRRLPVVVLAAISVAAIGFAATLQVPDRKSDGGSSGIFWSDEATYHSLAYSIGFDADLRYDREDLERVYGAGYPGGPSGLFLVRNPDSDGLYFAKAWVYSAVAAPLVRLAGDRGFFLLHALLLATMLAAGFAYARRSAPDGIAALWVVTYVLGSVVTLYFFWMTPEWFNCSLLFLATFLWLYKETTPGDDEGLLLTTLRGGWSDYAAALVYGVAIFSKPPNLLLVGPLLAALLLQRRWRRAVGCGMACGGVIVLLFAVTWASIGSWNYQGGDRKQFNVLTGYPLAAESQTFDSVGIDMTTNLDDFADAFPPPSTLARDALYVWIGRNGGLLPYMFPAILALGAFLFTGSRRWTSPQGLLVAFWLLELVAIVVVVRGNWIGGGGTVGSRYFANLYPVLFFVVPATVRPLGNLACWTVWGVCLAQVVANPFASSLRPAAHTTGLPYTLLPTEVSILHSLPFNTNPRARKVLLTQPAGFWVYFLDDDTFYREGSQGGFWVRGADEAEFVLRTVAPIETISLRLRNRTRPNRVVVRHAGTVLERQLAPDEAVDLQLPAGEAHRYIEGPSWLYRISVRVDVGAIPRFDTPGSNDARDLGVFVRPEVAPFVAVSDG